MNGGVTGGLCGVLAALAFGVACSSTTTHADGGAGAGGGGRAGSAGGGAGAAGGGGFAGHAGGGGAQIDSGGCRVQGQTCSDTQLCCGPLICTGICTTPVSQNDSGADVDASDASVDGGPSICAEIRPLVLSNPVVISGSVAGGQTVTMQITLSDTDPNGYVSYPGAILTSATPGVSFAPSQTGPPGAYIDGTMSKPMTFYVKLAATIPAGTEVQISARAFQSGHTAPDCNAFVLSFSLTTI